MASLNKVMLIGNLGKDPEIRQTASGQMVASFSLATKEKYKNKSGEWEEKTEWHNVTLWAKLAEITRDYLAKGKTVFIEGRLQTRKWQDASGNDRYTTEIVGEKMQLLTPKDSTSHNLSNSEPKKTFSGNGISTATATPDTPDAFRDDLDDIPF